MDNRIRLPEGFCISQGGRNYTISRYISAGGNSIVYQAWYQDSLMPEKMHQVLLKELYPLDHAGRIMRREDLYLEIGEGAQKLYADHKKSYLLGNQVHLTLSQEGLGGIAENLDSFQANNTLYTVLTAKKGKVLGEFLKEGEEFPTATQAVVCINNLLTALAGFHNHFMLEPTEKGAFPTELLLLDFNSVYSMDNRNTYICDYYPGKPGYMAPEAELSRIDELGPWTDLYSAAAVLYCLLNDGNAPEDLEIADTSELVSPYSRLLLHEKEVAAEQVNRILRKGLRTLPENRYQSTGEMLQDLQELLDILSGAIRIPVSRIEENSHSPSLAHAGPGHAGTRRRRWPARAGAAACAVLLAAAAFLGGRMSLVSENDKQNWIFTSFLLKRTTLWCLHSRM